MVSYYNSLPFHPKHSNNMPYTTTQPWFPSTFHASNTQFMSDVESPPHPQQVYYGTHPMFHQAGHEWTHENFHPPQSHLLHQNHPPAINPNNSTPAVNLNNSNSTGTPENLGVGIPSPPITVSGSDVSSPGIANGAISPQVVNNINVNNNRPTAVKSPYYDWMKKPSYPTQTNPGKTRTKDKYRVVYTDFQRLELEKEYHTARYISIRRKTEIAQSLQLSERQVKIWFQNRRAKERKQTKKRDDPLISGLGQHNSPGLVNMLDTKPKLEGNLHIQHPLHQMSSMTMGMNPMSLTHSVLHHHGHHGHLAVPPPPPQHLHQAHQQLTVTANGLSM